MRKFLACFLSLVMIVSTLSCYALAADTTWGNDYEQSTEFYISTASDLTAFATMVNEGKDFCQKTVKLTDNIDLSNVAWTPIGTTTGSYSELSGTLNCVFAGTFNGNNYTISGLNYTSVFSNGSPTVHAASGLFGFVSGTVTNVVVSNASVSSLTGNAGGVVGILLKGGKISNCSISGTISAFEISGNHIGSNLGGIVGTVDGESTIENCVNNAKVSGVENIGGIVGSVSEDISSSTIKSCTNKGTIVGTESVGGVIGLDEGGCSVSDCENNGSISGQCNVGGIAGETIGTLSDCRNDGVVGPVEDNAINESIDGNGYHVGGIVGLLGGSVEECQNSGAISGDWTLGGIVGDADSKAKVTSCTNTGSVTGASQSSGTNQALGDRIGGIIGENGGSVSACANSGAVSGETSVGGIVGDQNGDASSIANCISTGKVTGQSNVGTIVGTNGDPDAGVPNYDQSKDKPGDVQNNFWPESLGTSAVGGGTGSSTDSSENEKVKNNSSYKADGTLTTPISTESGEDAKRISNLGEALKEITSSDDGSTDVPDALKVTVTYNKDGHGDNTTDSVPMGTKITLEKLNNVGYYTFLNWTVNGEAVGETYTVMADTIFTASWRNDKPSSSSNPSYSITTPSQTEGGAVAVSSKNAKKGATVTLTVTPDQGYQLSSLTVTDAKGNQLTLTDQGGGKYTFVMPASKVDVAAAFAKIPDTHVCPSAHLTDIDTTQWYHEGVDYVVSHGMMVGVTPTTFGPNDTTTRGMIVTILYRLEGSPAVTAANPFTDVADNEWYGKAVIWAAENGVVTGDTPTTFSPNDPITREQMAAILYRYASLKGYDVTDQADLSGYTDAGQVSSYATQALQWANQAGLITGTTPTTLSPTGNALRAQVATIFQRFCESVAQ